MVLADRRGHLMALIGIEGGTVGDWASRRGLALTSYGDLARAPEVHALVGECVAEVNAAQADPIERFALLEKELDHEDGELTATLQVRRRALERRFESQIARGVIA
jgi:long-chain acyl-CoA synthetase